MMTTARTTSRATATKSRLRLEALEPRTLLSTVITETEPNNRRAEANEVTFDPADGAADVSGTSDSRRDRDFFHFHADAASPVNLSIDGTAGFVGKVTVEDAAGRKLFETEPNDGVNSGSFTVQAGQDIFVRVRAKNRDIGDYTLHLTLSGGAGGGGGGGGGGDVPPDALIESEPNDRQASADAFDLGADGAIQLLGTSLSDRDKDFFVFTPTTSGSLTVAVQSTGGATAALEVEDNLGNTVFETEPNNGVNSGNFAVTAGVTYFVRLRAPNRGPASYLVDLTLA